MIPPGSKCPSIPLGAVPWGELENGDLEEISR
jgi:hypothetical protein